MEKDLGLKGNQYQIATSILFVSYVVCVKTYLTAGRLIDHVDSDL